MLQYFTMNHALVLILLPIITAMIYRLSDVVLMELEARKYRNTI